MFRVRVVACSAVVLSVVSTAEAEETNGRVRLSLDGTLVDHRAITTTVTVENSVTGAKEEIDQKLAVSTGGLLSSGFGVGVGGGVGRRALLGTRALFATSTADFEDFGKSTTSTVALVPYLQYIAAPGKAVRPSLGLEAGFEHSVSESEGEVVSSSTVGLFGVSGGIHGFVARGFSIDPTLGVYALAGNTKLGPEAESSASGVAVIARVSFSGWLGKGKPAPPAPDGESGGDGAGTDFLDDGLGSETGSRAPGVQSAIQRGVVSESLAIESATTFNVQTNPLSAPAVAKVALVIRGGDAEAQCDSLALEIGGTAHDVSDAHFTRRGGGFSSIASLSGTLPLEVVREAGMGSGPLVIAGCGKRFKVPEVQLRKLVRLATASRRMLDGSRLSPRFASVRDNGGTLDMSAVMTRQASLRLVGQPVRAGGAVTLSLVWRSDAPKFADCSNLKVVAPNGHWVGTDVKRNGVQRGSRVVDSIAGNVDVQAAVAIAEARRPVKVEACGTVVEVPDEARERAWQFVQVFARRAIKAGSWPAPPAGSSSSGAEGEGIEDEEAVDVGTDDAGTDDEGTDDEGTDERSLT